MTANKILYDLMMDEEFRDIAQSHWYVRAIETNKSTHATTFQVWAEDVLKALPFTTISRDGTETAGIRWLEYVVALHNEQLDWVALRSLGEETK